MITPKLLGEFGRASRTPHIDRGIYNVRGKRVCAKRYFGGRSADLDGVAELKWTTASATCKILRRQSKVKRADCHVARLPEYRTARRRDCAVDRVLSVPHR